MSLQDEPRLRQEALVHATIAVKNAKRNGTILVIKAEAERIYRMIPNCPVSRADLRAEMIRLGLSDRVAIEFAS